MDFDGASVGDDEECTRWVLRLGRCIAPGQRTQAGEESAGSRVREEGGLAGG